ncbi:MAG: UDP-N-acetylglucosamine 2-epimerase (non-hydrolyzing) [Acidobacteria bacterium]|nr:UDP-N-acetylglucosamine 2-epimerase (non-hydrolyzing) [Acidobacteriota bacterium]
MTNPSPTPSVRRRRILVPYGTRPEIIKLAPVVRALRAVGHSVITVNTGQHSDAPMSGDLSLALGLETTITNVLTLDKSSRLGQIVSDALRIVSEHRPDLVLALGDTDTVPAYALAAKRSSLPFVHLEAGLRSFNQRSAEELNRKIGSASASLHFAPTERSRAFLRSEGVDDDRIRVVGNSVIDALLSTSLSPLGVEERFGVLVTAHRATNVDDPQRLSRFVGLVNDLASTIGPVTFPVHPRTAQRMAQFLPGVRFHDQVTLSPPLGYFSFIDQLRRSLLVVTDSGGLQEEASYFGVPLVVLRGSTSRWESVENGSVRLATLDDDQGAARAREAANLLTRDESLRTIATIPCPYGDGHTGEAVARYLGDPSLDQYLILEEPSFLNGEVPW